MRCFGIAFFTTVGSGIPGGVESELGARGHANPIMRNRAENDGAGRETITVYDYHLARTAQALILIDVDSHPAATILPNPNRRIACPNAREHDNRHQ